MTRSQLQVFKSSNLSYLPWKAAEAAQVEQKVCSNQILDAMPEVEQEHTRRMTRRSALSTNTSTCDSTGYPRTTPTAMDIPHDVYQCKAKTEVECVSWVSIPNKSNDYIKSLINNAVSGAKERRSNDVRPHPAAQHESRSYLASTRRIVAHFKIRRWYTGMSLHSKGQSVSTIV